MTRLTRAPVILGSMSPQTGGTPNPDGLVHSVGLFAWFARIREVIRV